MKKVVVAMSGGVDSSVAAFLLKEQGYDVTGVTLLLLTDSHIKEARTAAKQIGIEHCVLDLRKEFKRDVINYFSSEYEKGRTPNPCVVCNRKIKFGKLLERARILGADFLATGHYARLGKDADAGRYFIREAADRLKDQSYFLFSLTQDQIRHVIFPLGELTKKDVKEIAKNKGLKSAERPESQDICFILDGDYRNFLKGKIKGIRPGKVVDTEGKVLGKHKGIAFYTVGQREGLDIAAGRPVYVVKLDRKRNEVVLGDAEAVRGRELTAGGMSWMAIDGLSKPMRAQAKIRYNHAKAKCKVLPLSKNRIKVIFDEPQFAITPGQAFVFYNGDKLLGGGWID